MSSSQLDVSSTLINDIEFLKKKIFFGFVVFVTRFEHFVQDRERMQIFSRGTREEVLANPNAHEILANPKMPVHHGTNRTIISQHD